MPRIARVVYPDFPHHITQRGNYKQNIFSTDQDLVKYQELIIETNKHLSIEILAYCFMKNHVHFIMVPPDENSLAVFFNYLSMRYSQYFNKKLNRKGHLWQDRFYSCPLDRSHLYEAIRYVENNPVRAGFVKHASDYKWSSARSRINNYYSDNPFLTRISKYLDELEIMNWQDYLDSNYSKELIQSIRTCTSTGRPAGNKKFIEDIEMLTGRKLKKKTGGRPRSKKN